MDNLRPLPRVRFVPDRRLTALAAGGAVAALLASLFGSDAPGRLLAGIGAVLLAAYVVTDLVYSPRLVVSRDGLDIRSPFATAHLGWGDVERVHADVRQRFGLRSTTLEIEGGAVLAVLSRRSLGADPEQVAAVVADFRPPG